MGRVLEIGEGFWNIRGSFKIGGLVDIGTQCSLVRLKSGRFVLLDACELEGETLQRIQSLTDGGDLLEAVLHLHPFHTVWVKRAHALFPDAKLFGTERHVRRAPALPWQPQLTDSPACHAVFADDLEFDVPRGVDFISTNDAVHFSSVLALHPASRTLHVDDTLSFNRLPVVGGLKFHPTLKAALERRPGAARDFRAWARALAEKCSDVDTLCAAHAGVTRRAKDGPVKERVLQALARVEKTLAAHEKRYG